MKSANIAIVILHYKNLTDTQECLKSLQKLAYERFSAIVVNNSEIAHKTALEADFGAFIRVIQNTSNLGFAEGNNVGIRAALQDNQTDYVMILNNDTIVEPNFLDEMIKIDADMIAPRMMQFDHKDKVDNLGIVLMSSGLPFNRTHEDQKLFCPSGGCALYSRRLLTVIASEAKQSDQRVDFFDPTFFTYAEDLDLGWRARNAGFETKYAKDAIIYHKGSVIHGKLSDFAVYHTYRNLLWAQFKNMPLGMMLIKAPMFLLGRALIFLYYTFKGRFRLILKSYAHGEIGVLKMTNKRRENLKNKHVSNKKILTLLEPGLFPKNLLKN